jgi:hypothetical protein
MKISKIRVRSLRAAIDGPFTTAPPAFSLTESWIPDDGQDQKEQDCGFAVESPASLRAKASK